MEQVSGFVDHPTGRWYFACSADGLTRVSQQSILDAPELPDHPRVQQHAAALLNTLNGTTPHYALPVVLRGTEFQQRVWQAIRNIPFGKTQSYQAIAQTLGSNATRAIGTACGANPIPLAIPCHRVLRSNGDLGGFSMGGVEIKAKLLAYESSASPQRYASKQK